MEVWGGVYRWNEGGGHLWRYGEAYIDGMREGHIWSYWEAYIYGIRGGDIWRYGEAFMNVRGALTK